MVRAAGQHLYCRYASYGLASVWLLLTQGKFDGMLPFINDAHQPEHIGDYSQLKKYKTQLQRSHFNGNLKQSDLITHIPSRELADTLVHLYLTTFEPAYRILHVPSFWKEYHALWASPDSASVG